ncbi:hypothetical protein JTB14_006199 [Gonioctena quinquepunctata]|nr:hypothetical protein JTB14_006199 [Gonioctena quinquepunctata]
MNTDDEHIKAPEGLKTESKYLKLNRALYGLRYAPNIKLDQVMTKLNFKLSDYDYCLYTKNYVYLVLFMDDRLITGPEDQVRELLRDLRNEVNIKKMTEVKTVLGMEISKNEKGLKITQTRLLEEFSMIETGKVEVNFQVKEEEPIINNVPYRRLVCSLMYLSLVSRTDIPYLSRFLDKPRKSTWKAGKRISRYLNHTKEYALQFEKGNMQEVMALCDADWAGDQETRNTVSGFVWFHAGNPIAWHFMKQTCVAQSSMEAEYISAGTAPQELLSEFKANLECPFSRRFCCYCQKYLNGFKPDYRRKSIREIYARILRLSFSNHLVYREDDSTDIPPC